MPKTKPPIDLGTFTTSHVFDGKEYHARLDADHDTDATLSLYTKPEGGKLRIGQQYRVTLTPVE